jgi:hypothetical protein
MYTYVYPTFYTSILHVQVAAHYLYRLVDQHKEFEDGIIEFKVRMRLKKDIKNR